MAVGRNGSNAAGGADGFRAQHHHVGCDLLHPAASFSAGCYTQATLFIEHRFATSDFCQQHFLNQVAHKPIWQMFISPQRLTHLGA